MLPKRRRLSAYEVREVLKRGRTVRDTHLSMKFAKAEGSMRAAVVVQKSIATRAVERNRLRRAVYRALSTLPTPTGARVVFFVQKIPVTPLARAFATEAQGLLKKIS